MNDKEIRSKKQSIVLFKNTNDKTINNSHIKLGPHCQPKQPPNISRHYQETKKKQSQSREIMRQQYPIYCYEVERVRSKILMQARPSRPSQSKNQQEQKVKKTKRQPHYISKPHKARGIKINTKQNRESRSNIDAEDIRREKQKMAKTQVFEEKLNPSLTCKEKIIKKLKRNLKSGSEDLHANQHYRISSQQIIPKKSFAEEIAEFQASNARIQIRAESETLTELFYKEQAYSRIQNYNCYLVKKQPEITWTKRAMVMNWMIEILAEMGSRRQVFALAANYVDRYLALTSHLPQEKLQILACAAMSIANKIQGLTFSVGSFRISGISFTEVLDLQQQVCKTLKWKLNPPTLNMWANRIAQHWDLYLDHHGRNIPDLFHDNIEKIKFKDTESYLNFRTLMQYIDLVVLDIQTLQYHNRELAASFIYIMLAQKLNLFSRQEIFMKFPCTSQYLLKQNQLNDFYCEFLQDSFGFALQDLLPTIQYCSTFIMLPLTFQLPSSIQETDDNEVPFSQFCSLLTCNASNLSYLHNRARELE